jgi:hypothetical protein
MTGTIRFGAPENKTTIVEGQSSVKKVNCFARATGIVGFGKMATYLQI